MSSQNPIRRKLVIVGDGACGKTSLLCSFALGEFPKEYQPTIFENYVAEIRLDGKPVQLALWDTAGQEEYERLRPMSYSKSHVILIAFAIDTPDSLENVTVKWIEEVRSICGPTIPVILVGCKSDLRPPEGASVPPGSYVTMAEAQRVANAIGARAYKECSALKIEVRLVLHCLSSPCLPFSTSSRALYNAHFPSCSTLKSPFFLSLLIMTRTLILRGRAWTTYLRLRRARRC
ncbi:ras-domain-containing protein [Daedalea quercina L-15889]|uniref:Ras-domain-containing protein n=1 Tax=Daedalea quercina L-15889 TaxID=1314783 RepID=A0A165QEF2_9APHY|nr:ras-domain-containing protein [Daedalea quercina L-15889]